MANIEVPSRHYEVALSFAGEDRDYVDAVAHALRNKGLSVFYDKFEEADLLGRNLVDHLSEIYQHKARLCVVFVSAAYAKKPFPRLERQAAQSKAIESDEPYILPVRLDDTPIPGLLSTIAFTSGKTPEALALLIASKLLLTERDGYRLPDATPSASSILVRFNGLLELDMDALRQGIDRFDHWSDERIGHATIELRLPAAMLAEIRVAKDFQASEQWRSSELTDEARQQFSRFYSERLDLFNAQTVQCLGQILTAYWSWRKDRLLIVARRFLLARMIVLCRLIMDLRLVGMPPVSWQNMFAHFAHSWSEWIMYGLPYACSLEGDAGQLWIDVDGRDRSTAMLWPKARFRLYAPADIFLGKDDLDRIDPVQFDRLFAAQLVFEELDPNSGLPLRYFAEYPDRLYLTIRGEWAFDTDNFAQHGTSNFSGKPLIASVRKLREHAVAAFRSDDCSKFAEYLALSRVRSLFRDPSVFDAVLLPREDA